MSKINYEDCLVNLSSSILKEFGVQPKHSTLKDVDDILVKREWKNSCSSSAEQVWWNRRMPKRGRRMNEIKIQDRLHFGIKIKYLFQVLQAQLSGVQELQEFKQWF